MLHVTFNQDGTCLAVSTNLGFKIFQVCHPLQILKLHESREIGVVSLIEMQFRTNILAFVTRSSHKLAAVKSLLDQFKFKTMKENWNGQDNILKSTSNR